MELDQINKRVQWIDDERRKDRDAIALLENRILTLQGGLDAANQKNKELTGELARLSAIIGRIDQFDNSLTQQRIETKRVLDEMDKEGKKREEEAGKVLRLEMKNLNNDVIEIRKTLELLPKLEKGISSRMDEETRLARQIDELRRSLDDMRHDEEESLRTYRLIEDGRRQDTKRLNDLLAEVTGLRKRLDDQRAQNELTSNSLRKLETRLGELTTQEAERREAQSTFLDRQAVLQVERDRVWRDWETRFTTVEKQATETETQIQSLEVISREAKRAQQTVEELAQKLERRVSEITEIQRLSEERFRQEWVSFRADDQKRWTNYTLIQEEQRSESLRQIERLAERIAQLEDGYQENQDAIQIMNDQMGKQLQSILALIHEWVSTYERSIGRTR